MQSSPDQTKDKTISTRAKLRQSLKDKREKPTQRNKLNHD